MIKMKKYLLTTIVMMVALLSANTLQAQIRWKGSDYTTLLSGSGTRVYLYNVGTGRFIIHGGDWGSQARLFYEDTGKTLIIQKDNSHNNIFFEPGIETDGTPALGANIPLVTSAHEWGNDEDTYTILFDGQERIGYGSATGTYRNMHFVRVDEGDDNVFTYYIYEDFGTRSTKYNKENNGSGTASNADYSGVYLGAAYGENWNNQDGDPNGPLVLLSSSFDKATWSTVAPTSTQPWNCGVKNAALEGLPEGTTTVSRKMTDEVPIFNADTKVELRKLYQWRIVTEEQLLASMTNSDVNDGLSTNLTYLIYDRGFERNDWSFFDYWQTAQFTDASYTTSGNGRYKYTWGLLTGNRTDKGTNNQSGNRTVSGAWNIPVRLKAQFETKANAKFGFLEFEGIGTAYTYIDAPEAGVYKISCYGFYQGSNEGYLFATTTTPSSFTTTSFPATQKSAFKSVTGLSKDTEANVMAAGNDFVYDKDSYYREVEIHATAGQRIYFGVGKNAATRAQYNSTYYGTYCYDSDWVGADQFQISYLGTDEAKLLDEDETSSFTDYIGGTSDNPFINRTLRLHRTFQTGKWNSFIIPVDMTAVQVRNAFGDDARVAKLDGLGSRSNNAKIIDFVTIPLPAEGAAIEKGKFYLIMPTKEPTPGTGSTSNKPYYTIGAYTFSGPSLDAAKIAEDVFTPAEGAANPTEASVKTQGTFFSTPGYEYANGNQFAVGETKTDGTYIPAGSYVIGVKGDKTTIFRTQHDLKTKGFRAWLVDVEGETTQNTISSVAINGIADITAIDEVFADEMKAKPTNGIIYDISGRKVGDISNLNSSTLTKGIYIVNGKKIVIK